MAVSHLSVYFRLRHERGNGVHNQDVHSTGTHHSLRNIESLLSGIGLGHIEVINIHSDSLRISRIQGMLRIDKGRNPASLLYLCNGMKCQSGLTGRLRTVNLDNSSSRKAACTERNIHGKRSGRYHLDVLVDAGISQLHDGTLSAILLYLS